MTNRLSVLVAAMASIGLAAPVLADAAGAFRDGKWPVAISQGRAEATPASLTLAGRAQLAVAAYETRDKAAALAQVERAEKDFDAALAKAPGDAIAQLQKAVAIGYRAKLTKSPGLGKEARERFEAVRNAHPDYSLAWSAVGGWHGGAISTLGNFMASTIMGAKASEVDRNFGQALKIDPANPAARTLYAQVLLDMDRGNAAKAASVLNGIGALPAHDAVEAFLRDQGVKLAATIKAGDARAAQDLARRQQAFGMLA